ncbi:MAG TPA: membrane protein insertion efficiency factor YidD [Flavobacteriales bacterium]|nr:membrane protein insertion efficiency factor YidD [Flavobacteriales bacterium]
MWGWKSGKLRCYWAFLPWPRLCKHWECAKESSRFLSVLQRALSPCSWSSSAVHSEIQACLLGPYLCSMMRAILLWLIRGYQVVLSPLLGSNCRFQPTCSAYAAESLQIHGTWKGAWLALRRIGRCHPWTPPAYDPVPPKKITP